MKNTELFLFCQGVLLIVHIIGQDNNPNSTTVNEWIDQVFGGNILRLVPLFMMITGWFSDYVFKVSASVQPHKKLILIQYLFFYILFMVTTVRFAMLLDAGDNENAFHDWNEDILIVCCVISIGVYLLFNRIRDKFVWGCWIIWIFASFGLFFFNWRTCIFLFNFIFIYTLFVSISKFSMKSIPVILSSICSLSWITLLCMHYDLAGMIFGTLGILLYFIMTTEEDQLVNDFIFATPNPTLPIATNPIPLEEEDANHEKRY